MSYFVGNVIFGPVTCVLVALQTISFDLRSIDLLEPYQTMAAYKCRLDIVEFGIFQLPFWRESLIK